MTMMSPHPWVLVLLMRRISRHPSFLVYPLLGVKWMIVAAIMRIMKALMVNNPSQQSLVNSNDSSSNQVMNHHFVKPTNISYERICTYNLREEEAPLC
jgi:hypothetical protein